MLPGSIRIEEIFFGNNMLTRPGLSPVKPAQGYALGEVLLAFGVLSLVFVGLIYGYVQANRMAEWSSMSLAAQAYAAEGAEQARAADYQPRAYPQTFGPGGSDELTNGFSFTTSDIMDIPIKGSPTNTDYSFWVTNVVTVTNVFPNANPPLRQIRSECHWIFPLTGKLQTNTVILLRAPDQ
jgi:Tfp pilus assembly protein PilV